VAGVGQRRAQAAAHEPRRARHHHPHGGHGRPTEAKLKLAS
jgi:hypothetical protein